MSAHALERIADDPASPQWPEHMARYRFAAAFPGRRVLDVACGAGLGDGALSGRSVVGVDYSAEALARARRRGCRVARADGAALPFPTGAFDLVVSLETVEHVERDGAFVDELHRVLQPGGTLVMSTPNRAVVGKGDATSGNPFHVREYTPGELASLLGSFESVTLYGQVTTEGYGRSPFWTGARSRIERVGVVAVKVALRMPATIRRGIERVRGRTLVPLIDDFEFRTDAVAQAHDLIAVCRR